jgi:hypothetical protein
MYHDAKIQAHIPGQSLHSKYTSYTAKKLYFITYTLQALSYTEALLEMMTHKSMGNRRRWNFVTFLETLKAILRAYMLLSTRRMVLHDTIPQREIDVAHITQLPKKWIGERCGKTFWSIETLKKESLLLSSAVTVKNTGELMSKLDTLRFMSEWIYILRPLIYGTLPTK